MGKPLASANLAGPPREVGATHMRTRLGEWSFYCGIAGAVGGGQWRQVNTKARPVPNVVGFALLAGIYAFNDAASLRASAAAGLMEFSASLNRNRTRVTEIPTRIGRDGIPFSFVNDEAVFDYRERAVGNSGRFRATPLVGAVRCHGPGPLLRRLSPREYGKLRRS